VLDNGLDEIDPQGSVVRYRYLSPTTDLEELTVMLHEAYAPPAAAGMRYLASHQTAVTTRGRMVSGETIVALVDGSVVGMVTLSPPDVASGTPHYDRPGTASFEQFAVRPSYQGRGIGSRLLDLVEARAREVGAYELALDTSEHASHLIAMYEARGFRFVEHVQWAVTSYRSVVLSKCL
jgi:GNAT superfamily N-acetyltransferase